MRRLLIVLVLLVQVPAFAQKIQIPSDDDPRSAGKGPFLTSEMLPYWQKHFNLVNGRTNPQAIPYGVAMERAFMELQRGPTDQEFAQRLRTIVPIPATDSDVSAIEGIVGEADSVAASVRNDGEEKLYQLCSEMVAAQPETLNALDYAATFNAIEKEEADRLTAHYRAAVARLSGATRAALEAHVDTDIRPAMSWGHDLVGLAAEVPEAFLWHQRASCKQYVQRPESERKWQHTRIGDSAE